MLLWQRIISRGVVQDWDDFRHLLEHVFFEEIKLTKETVCGCPVQPRVQTKDFPITQLKETPVLLTEPPLNPKVLRNY